MGNEFVYCITTLQGCRVSVGCVSLPVYLCVELQEMGGARLLDKTGNDTYQTLPLSPSACIKLVFLVDFNKS